MWYAPWRLKFIMDMSEQSLNHSTYPASINSISINIIEIDLFIKYLVSYQ